MHNHTHNAHTLSWASLAGVESLHYDFITFPSILQVILSEVYFKGPLADVGSLSLFFFLSLSSNFEDLQINACILHN